VSVCGVSTFVMSAVPSVVYFCNLLMRKGGAPHLHNMRLAGGLTGSYSLSLAAAAVGGFFFLDKTTASRRVAHSVSLG